MKKIYQKKKLIYINGIGGALINLFEIIYLVNLYLKEKTSSKIEKTEASILFDDLEGRQNTFIPNKKF